MKPLALTACAALAASLSLTAFAPQARPSSLEYPTPEIREQQDVVIGGVTETWQLKWTAAPKPVCGPDDIAFTGPCTGFAYGEGGDLLLIRLRNGIEIDRLPLTQYCDEILTDTGKVVVVQRWQPDYEKDYLLDDDLPAAAAARPVVQVMHFADYDHDGERSEFFLQTGTDPGPKREGVVVGVSAGDQRLHVFGTSSHPAEPLHMYKENWEALRDASGPIDVLSWPCDDHGAQTETDLRLHWDSYGIDGSRRILSCPAKTGRLIEENPL